MHKTKRADTKSGPEQTQTSTRTVSQAAAATAADREARSPLFPLPLTAFFVPPPASRGRFSSDSGGNDNVYKVNLPSSTSASLLVPKAIEPWYGP